MPARAWVLGIELFVALFLPAAAFAQDAGTPAALAPVPAPLFEPPPGERYSDDWIEATLRDYQKRYPKLTRFTKLGASNEGRGVYALQIGRHLRKSDKRPAVLLNGAHHGLEFLSTDMVLDAIETLLLRSRDAAHREVPLRTDKELDRRVRRYLEELVIWCVPLVNPDGAWAALQKGVRTGRKNGRDVDGNGKIDFMDGVDLNRNYPFKWGFLGEVGSSSKPQNFYYRGPTPGSEPETQAMMSLADSEHFAAAISYHTGTVAVLAPYTIDNVLDPTPNDAWTVGEYVVAGLPPHPQGKPFTLKRKIYSVDGTDQDYYRFKYGTVALLVEGARRDAKDEAERQAVVNAARPSWTRLFDRFLDGPAISGHVYDVSGKPANVNVMVAEQKTHEGEAWPTRCRDGRFDRFVTAPGTYTLRITLPDAKPDTAPLFEQKVEVTSGRASVDITLPVAVPPSQCPERP